MFRIEKEYFALQRRSRQKALSVGNMDFKKLLPDIEKHIKEYVFKAEKDGGVELPANAAIGKPEAVAYIISEIEKFLDKNGYTRIQHPEWYSSLSEGLFHEIWGSGCIANFFKMKDSSSAKIIGERVYYLIDGVEVLQPQKMYPDSWNQLKSNIVSNDTTNSINKRNDVIELNLRTGERVTLFINNSTKPGQESMVIRKYIVKNMTWEEQAKRNTIPIKAVNFFKYFAQVGYNVLFAGQVRSGKTTFLTTWQQYENPELEGVLLEKTSEIPIHEIMPSAPIVQLLLPKKDDKFKTIMAHILRSDPNYVVMAEARVSSEFSLMVDVANKGTRRCKTTMHTSDVKTAIYDITDEILSEKANGSLDDTIFKVAKSFHYIIELMEDSANRATKKLKSITEIQIDRANGRILSVPICRYDIISDSWEFNDYVGKDKEEIAIEEAIIKDENKRPVVFDKFKKELSKLAKLYPMKDKRAYVTYSREKEGNTWINYQ